MNMTHNNKTPAQTGSCASSSSPPSAALSVLITGASGFIGSFLAEEALSKGMEVWAAVRPSSSRKYLRDGRIRFIELDFGHEERLRKQLEAHRQTHGTWHHVIHAAGATKCRRTEDFFRTNTEGTLNLACLLLETRTLTGRFVFISSLSVYGPVHEQDYEPVKVNDTPCPNTAYGRSKLMAEQGLKGIKGLDYIILRPTGVYGPREKDYFLMAKSIKQHIDFAVGFRRQVLTFIYVRDLVAAAFLALERGKSGTGYFLTDGKEYSSRRFSDLLQEALGVRCVLHITAPLWVLRTVSMVCGGIARLTGRTSTLNMDKYNIMKQRNWRCDISPARHDLGYNPQYGLEKGVAESVAWYKKEQWI